jgi:hypothetical protein
MSDVPKKKKMLDYLLETRRQMIKMLVLVKWAKVSKEVEQCIVWFPSRRSDLRMSCISYMDSEIVSTIL